MRFVTYREDDGDRVGVLAGGRSTPSRRRHAARPPALRAGPCGRPETVRSPRPAPCGPTPTCSCARPLPDPPTVRDFMTFERHVEGVARLAGDHAGRPRALVRGARLLLHQPLRHPRPARRRARCRPGCQLFDLELEVAAVIGRTGRDVHPDEGASYIAGYTILDRLVRPRPPVRGDAGPARTDEGQGHGPPRSGPCWSPPTSWSPGAPTRLRPGHDRRRSTASRSVRTAGPPWPSPSATWSPTPPAAPRFAPATCSGPAPAAAVAWPSCGVAMASTPTHHYDPATS